MHYLRHTLTAAIALLAACNTVREGSVLVLASGRAYTNAPPPITAAANGANAQNAGNHSAMDAKGSGSLQLSRSVWTWILIGAGVVIAGWLVWKFVFTGARIALVK